MARFRLQTTHRHRPKPNQRQRKRAGANRPASSRTTSRCKDRFYLPKPDKRFIPPARSARATSAYLRAPCVCCVHARRGVRSGEARRLCVLRACVSLPIRVRPARRGGGERGTGTYHPKRACHFRVLACTLMRALRVCAARRAQRRGAPPLRAARVRVSADPHAPRPRRGGGERGTGTYHPHTSPPACVRACVRTCLREVAPTCAMYPASPLVLVRLA